MPKIAVHPSRLTLIVGTNRPGSMTRRIARVVEEIYAAQGEPLHVLDLADLPSRLFRPEAYARKPVPFRAWSEAVVRARGLIVLTPEYNGGMPGVLKYFIDLLPFPESFERKPVCFIGLADGHWGALRPVEQLQQVFGYRQAHIYPERVFLPHVGTLFDVPHLRAGDTRTRLTQQAAGFRSFCQQLPQSGIPAG